MKKSQTKTEVFIKDLDSVLNLVSKIDNLDPEKTDLKQLNKVLKNKQKEMKKKYKDLDTKE